jgi:penicillin-insensitive murein DD-endopeptidase
VRFAAVLALLIGLAPAGCVELGVVTDGTSVSVGRPSRGRIVDPARIPERGEGFLTREIWKARGNRYGTDELVDLLVGVSGRVLQKNSGVRLVVADLSGRGGGAAHQWHRSHQSGRDVDLLYYLKDKTGKSFENDAMHVVGPDLVAKDGSGHTVDVPRMWNLVKELLTAPEAPVQWVFVYQPVANAIIEHAIKIGEPEVLVERAKKVCKQPGDSAPHNDHMHVRVYCSYQDRAYGCVDIGPMEMLAEREVELEQQQQQIASVLDVRPPTFTEAVQAQLPSTQPASAVPAMGPGGQPASAASAAPTPPAAMPVGPGGVIGGGDLRSLQRLVRTGAYRVDLWRWR